MFGVYFDQLLEQVQKNAARIPELDKKLQSFITMDLNQNIEGLLQDLLRQYIKEILESFNSSTKEEQIRVSYYHIDKLLDCLSIDKIFMFEDDTKE